MSYRVRLWRWNMIDSEIDQGTWQRPLEILTTKDRWSEFLTYVTDIVQPEETNKWKSINTHTHTHAHTRQPMKRNFTWSTTAIHLRSRTVFLSQLKFWFAKKLKMNLRIAPAETSFCKLSRPCQNSRCFQEMVQLLILCESCYLHNWPTLPGQKQANNN